MKKIRAKRIISFILTMAMIVGILPAGVLNVGAAESDKSNTFADPALISLTDEPIELNWLSADEPPDDDLSSTDIAKTLEEIKILENDSADETILEDELSGLEEEPLFESYIYENAITYGDFEYIVAEPLIRAFAVEDDVEISSGTITKYTGSDVNVIIPSSINGVTITAIGNRAFENCTGLVNVTLPDSMKTIGSYAFSGCTGLTSVTIQHGTTTIGMTEVPYGTETIGSYAFSGCTELTSMTIPVSVKTIDRYAFSGCAKLREMNLGSGVTSMGDRAFSGTLIWS